MKFQVSAIALGCAVLISGCGGGGGSTDGGTAQSISFNFPGGPLVGIPPNVTTTKLVAQASGGGAVTFTSETPTTCTVSGDTLSLIKAGECSVTAHQAGGNGYAAASQRQLFVIPKNTQVVAKFQNPGWQPVGGAPVQLAATFDTGLPVTFTSKTPAVCSVSGNTMTPLANGLCTVTATQAGNDVYAAITVDKNIPIGTELPAKLNFLSAYNDDPNTKDGGVGHAGGFWWCWDCDHKVSSDNTSLTFRGVFSAPPGGWQYDHAAFKLYGPNITPTDLWFPGTNPPNEKDNTYRDGVSASAFSTPSATPKGAQVDIQGNLHFNLAENPEWFNSTDNSFSVEIFLAHFNTNKLDSNGNACYVSLKATVKPTSAAATDYSIGLKDKFAISQTCDLTGLDLWTELQTYPVVEIKFSAVKPNGETTSLSNDTPPKPVYVSAMTLTGPIYFQ